MSTLAENVAKVTAAHAALKTAIAAKGVPVPDGTKLSAMPALVEQIQTGGGTPEPNVSRAVFAGDTSTSITVPSVMVVSTSGWTTLKYCFYNCSKATAIHLPDGFGQAATSLDFCFYNCSALTNLHLPDGFGQAATSLNNCFFSCSALTAIHLPDGFGQASNDNYNAFRICYSLTTITGGPKFRRSLELSTCPDLTHDSLMVIINGLQTVTSSQTLTLGTTNLAKLTDEEKKIATDKGWTLA